MSTHDTIDQTSRLFSTALAIQLVLFFSAVVAETSIPANAQIEGVGTADSCPQAALVAPPPQGHDSTVEEESKGVCPGIGKLLFINGPAAFRAVAVEGDLGVTLDDMGLSTWNLEDPTSASTLWTSPSPIGPLSSRNEVVAL